MTKYLMSVRGNEEMYAAGSYLNAKEHIGGFWTITARDLDASQAWAAKASAPCMSPVEVRQFQQEAEGV